MGRVASIRRASRVTRMWKLAERSRASTRFLATWREMVEAYRMLALQVDLSPVAASSDRVGSRLAPAIGDSGGWAVARCTQAGDARDEAQSLVILGHAGSSLCFAQGAFKIEAGGGLAGRAPGIASELFAHQIRAVHLGTRPGPPARPQARASG